jgi:hypothetical protein
MTARFLSNSTEKRAVIDRPYSCEITPVLSPNLSRSTPIF